MDRHQNLHKNMLFFLTLIGQTLKTHCEIFHILIFDFFNEGGGKVERKNKSKTLGV